MRREFSRIEPDSGLSLSHFFRRTSVKPCQLPPSLLACWELTPVSQQCQHPPRKHQQQVTSPSQTTNNRLPSQVKTPTTGYEPKSNHQQQVTIPSQNTNNRLRRRHPAHRSHLVGERGDDAEVSALDLHLQFSGQRISLHRRVRLLV